MQVFKQRTEQLMKFVFTVFQKEYSTYTMGDNGTRRDHSKFTGLLHDTIVAKKIEIKLMAKAAVMKAAEVAKAQEEEAIKAKASAEENAKAKRWFG